MLYQSHPLSRYGLAIASVGIALAFKLALNPYLHFTQASFLLFFGATTISALYGGRSAGITATLLSAVFANYFFLSPLYSLKLGLPSALRMALFIFEGLLVSILIGSLRIAQAQVRQNLSQLNASETAVKELNQTLQRRVDELQTLFNVIPVNIAIAEDSDSQVIKVNPTFAQLLQIPTQGNTASTPLSHTQGSLLKHRFYQDGQELTRNMLPLQYAAKQGIEQRDLEIELIREDNAAFSLYGHAVPLFDERGQPRGSVSVFVDISDRKRIEREREQLLERERLAREDAERANRVKDEFLAILSHELRSPLNPILGWARLLQTKQFEPQKAREALATIERNAKLQTQLIDDLLDIARILRGKLKLEEAPVNLASVIESAQEVVRTAAEAKSISLKLDLTDICQVRGDEGRLQQIVWNLLSNAIKFTPEGGCVTVRLEQVTAAAGESPIAAPSNDAKALSDKGSSGCSWLAPQTNRYARIVVTDTGKGISREFLPYLFHSFRQEDVSITRRHGGLGLGLSIVKYLVDAHGGTITADSPGEGQGATFAVQLPLLAEETQLRPNGALSSAQIDLTGVKILAVDDSQDTRFLLETALMQYGAVVKVMASGAEMLTVLPTFHPDLLICDIGMPEMDGYTLLQQIRALPAEQGGTLPAIALTAFAREEDYQRSLDQGFQTHLAKPIVPEKLAIAITQLIHS